MPHCTAMPAISWCHCVLPLQAWFKAFVVEEFSARYHMDRFVIVPGVDHITVCKPSTNTAASYLFLKQYLREVHGASAQWLAAPVTSLWCCQPSGLHS